MWLEEKIFAGPVFRVSNLWVYIFLRIIPNLSSFVQTINLVVLAFHPLPFGAATKISRLLRLVLSQEWLLVGVGVMGDTVR